MSGHELEAEIDPLLLDQELVSVKVEPDPLALEEEQEQKVKTEEKDNLENTKEGLEKRALAWADKCDYECVMCGLMLLTTNGCKNHLEVHKVDSQYDFMHFFSPIQIEKDCQICHSHQFNSGISLTNHLLSNHRVTLSDYYRTFVNTPGASGNKNSVVEAVFEDWCDDKCDYTCGMDCERHFTSRLKLFEHFRQHEHCKRNSSEKGTGNKSSVWYWCHVPQCKTLIAREQAQISLHARLSHSWGLRDFFLNRFASASTDNDELVLQYKSFQNSCEFQCRICSQTFVTHVDLTNHITFRHKVAMPSYIKMCGPLMSKVVKTICIMCNEIFVQTETELTKHMKREHEGMTPLEYFLEYIVNDKVPRKKTNQDEKKKVVIKTTNQEIKPAGNDGMYRLLKDMVGENKCWMNNCVFRCGSCQKFTGSKMNLGEHLDLQHGLTWEQHSEQFGDPGYMMYKFTCRLCGFGDITHDSKDIEEHLHITHNLSPDEYLQECLKPRCDSECCPHTFYVCGVCKRSLDNKDDVQRHIKDSHFLEQDAYSKFYGDIVPKLATKHSWACKVGAWPEKKATVTCSLCKNVYTDKAKLDVHLREHHQCPPTHHDQDNSTDKSKTVGDHRSKPVNMQTHITQPDLQCHICPKTFADNQTLRKHIINDHGLRSVTDTSSSKVKLHPNVSLHIARVKVTPRYFKTHQWGDGQSTSKRVKHEDVQNMSEWLDLGSYSCKVCAQKETTKALLLKHVEDNHLLDEKSYSRLFGKIDNLVHKCCICSIEIPHESKAIKTHLDKYHAQPIVAYFNKYICRKDPEIDPK